MRRKTKILGILIGVFCLFLIPKFVFAQIPIGNYQAELVDRSPSQVKLKIGETKELWVKFKNKGDVVWLKDVFRLGTSNPRDRSSVFLSSNRVEMIKEKVKPGEIAEFRFKIKAKKVGKFREYFALVADGFKWLSNEIYWDIEVEEAKFKATYLGQSPYPEILAGEIAELWIEFRNDGNISWKKDVVRLGTSRPLDRGSIFSKDWLSQNRIEMNKEEVKPGETVKFTFKIKAPFKEGVYREYFRLVADGIKWFDDIGIYWDIRVEPKIYKARFVKKSPDPILKPGETKELWVEFKNEGNISWKKNGINPVRLGTFDPIDRSSLFFSGNRIELKENEIKPGSIARFSFKIKAPVEIGTYKEKFALVVDGLKWLFDTEIEFNIKVEKELVLKNPIRVGLTFLDAPSFISANGDFVVRDGKGNFVKRYKKGEKVKVELAEIGYFPNSLSFIPINDAILQIENPRINKSYNRFRGILTFVRSKYSSRAWVVNELELEDYLKGLAEVPDNWPKEALKAQVIAARTYALRNKLDPKADIFDLYDDVRSQVYLGFNSEIQKPNQKIAVEETKGLVVKYKGELALTYYFSDSGGATEDISNVWGTDVAYLVSISDPYSLPISWEYNFSNKELKEIFYQELQKAGLEKEIIVDIEIKERFPSNRVKEMIFKMSSGRELKISYLDINKKIGWSIKSSMFWVKNLGPEANPSFKFYGKGWGHGVGMPQWSAKRMAEKGMRAEEIINYFYPGTYIEG